MESVWRDVVVGLRGLRKSPGFTAIAVLVLALGIGANTAIFSIADAFLLKPVNLPDIAHLVVVLELAPGETTFVSGVSPANYLDWKKQATSFDDMTMWEWNAMNLTGEGLPENVQGYKVEWNFFSICSAQPLLGRTFSREEDRPGQDSVAVLSYGLWARRFASDPGIIGRTIRLNAQPYTVIGVMPRDFSFPVAAELWTPLALTPDLWARRDWRAMFAMARLKPGATLEASRAEMSTIAQRLGAAYPTADQDWHVYIEPIRIFAIGDNANQYTQLMLGAVGFVLLLVCANVGNLQLVRGARRIREIAIRSALGCSRWRIIRQLLTESVLVAFAGALLSLLISNWTLRIVLAGMPTDVMRTIPNFDAIRLDFRALLFTMAIAIAAGVLAGLFPAVESMRVPLNDTLKEGTRGGTSSRNRHRIRNILVVIQVGLAVVLLSCAGLIIRAFRGIENGDARYRADSLLTMTVNLPDSRYTNHAQRSAFVDAALEKLGSMPGVTSAASTTIIPHTIGTSKNEFAIQEHPWTSASESKTADLESVSPNYFRTMGVPLLRGREFTAADATGGAQVAVISESLARAYWPKQDAVGHVIKFGAYASKSPWATIVGVVADVQMDWSDVSAPFAIYRPYRQSSRVYTSFAVRASVPPNSLVSASRSAIAAVDPNQPLLTIKPMRDVIHESLFTITYVAAMLGVLGGLAVLLAALGVYGVLAFTVTESTTEIGIRMALGALPRDILRFILGRGMLLTAVGLLLGLPISYGMSKLLQQWLPGVRSVDPAIFASVALALMAAALVACWFPARRATRTEPIAALRHE
jgi:putative ABC transport system permease protein